MYEMTAALVFCFVYVYLLVFRKILDIFAIYLVENV